MTIRVLARFKNTHPLRLGYIIAGRQMSVYQDTIQMLSSSTPNISSYLGFPFSSHGHRLDLSNHFQIQMHWNALDRHRNAEIEFQG